MAGRIKRTRGKMPAGGMKPRIKRMRTSKPIQGLKPGEVKALSDLNTLSKNRFRTRG